MIRPAAIRAGVNRAAGVGLLALALAACSPSYSPDTYASRAVQQANKVEAGVVAGRRPVEISADGTTGAVTGAAAGGVAGTRAGGGDITSAFAGIGGGLIGGLIGTGVEKAVGSSPGYEYIVRKPNGEMVSVVQRDETPLAIGQRVLVIAGQQARIVADYTVPNETPPAPAPKPHEIVDPARVQATPLNPPPAVGPPPPAEAPAAAPAAPGASATGLPTGLPAGAILPPAVSPAPAAPAPMPAAPAGGEAASDAAPQPAG